MDPECGRSFDLDQGASHRLPDGGGL